MLSRPTSYLKWFPASPIARVSLHFSSERILIPNTGSNASVLLNPRPRRGRGAAVHLSVLTSRTLYTPQRSINPHTHHQAAWTEQAPFTITAGSFSRDLLKTTQQRTAPQRGKRLVPASQSGGQILFPLHAGNRSFVYHRNQLTCAIETGNDLSSSIVGCARRDVMHCGHYSFDN